ncbi:DUF3137 domain-containing protein [Moritella viscosa]
MSFSEVNTISLQSGHYESSRSINKTVFNGIFFKVDVDNFFERALFVCPNESRLDRYFGLPKKINDEYMRKYVSLESPDFSEYFNVFCNDLHIIIIGNIKLVTELIESFSLSCETAGSL